MKTIEERAGRAIYEPTDGHPLKACEVVAFARGYELGATEQKAIDDVECANQVIMGKGSAINHYKQGYHDAVNKACELLKAVGVLTDDDSIMGFIKAMEDSHGQD